MPSPSRYPNSYVALLSSRCSCFPPHESQLRSASLRFTPADTGAAGGYDAIVLLIVDQQKVIDGVEKVWGEWTEMKVKPLRAGNSNGGLRSETVEGVDGLQAALDRL